jgi:hypothetical protein
MSLEEINYTAEIIASIAVIASLIYIGREVSQNTAAMRTAAAQASVNAVNDYVGLINSADKLADILHEGARGLSSLQGGDLIRFMAFNEQSFIACQSYYLQWKDGTLDDRLWQLHRQTALEQLSQPGQQEFWSLRRHWFFPEFVDYIENLESSGVYKPMHQGAVVDQNSPI